jgi:tetratricopeptide (TPR) repeat protein
MQRLALVWAAPGRDTSCTPACPQMTEGSALYTPQRLFGEVGSSSDILTHEPFLERARLQREQERDGLARLALGAYVVARLIDKLLTIQQDGESMEGFRWQLEAVRRHIGELPGDSPETAHLAGVVASIPAAGPATAGLWKGLTAYAYFLEHEGRLEESLEILGLAVRTQGRTLGPSDFAPYALLAGRLNRRLARWEPATACYQAALDAASSVGDQNRALRARLGRAHVYRARGNLPRARAEVEEVVSDAAHENLPDVESDAHLDLGVILMLQGARVESLEATYKSFQLCQDPLNRMRILGDLGYALSESGYFGAARLALEVVARSNSSYLVKLNALLELMQLESAVGNRVAFERYRQQAKELGTRMTPSMAVDFRYKTAIGLARFGQAERAREIAGEALALAEQHNLNEWYFRVERALKGFETASGVDVAIEARAEADATPAVLRMTTGLREYALLSAV